MSGKSVFRSLVLLPLSKLYGFGVGLRNLLFRIGLLHQRSFDVPVVVVGNIAAGGTGKTPHTEYIVDALRFRFRIGVLSRGYKRKTKGFVLASSRTTPRDIGDEPYQIYQKFGDNVRVAVCEDRCAGIDELLKIDPSINLIVLDDAFQHRYVKPAVSIVLTEFGRPYYMDKLLPFGGLREPASAVDRADIVIVTKCPDQIKPIESRILQKDLHLYPCQSLFFSHYAYEKLQPLFPDQVTYTPYLDVLGPDASVIALCGIGNPKPFVSHLKRGQANVVTVRYPDHHNFTRRDIQDIAQKFEQLPGSEKYIITTEKDAVRLVNNPYFPHSLKPYIFYLPIAVEFDQTFSGNFAEDLVKRIRDASVM